MTVERIAKLNNFEALHLAQDCEVSGVFCGDLLSWVMGRAQEGQAWLTVMGNINAVAVAHLAGTACIVLCENSAIMDDALERAKAQHINILKTSLPVFEAAINIAKAMEQ